MTLAITGIDPGTTGAIITAKFDDGILVDALVMDIPITKEGKTSVADGVALMSMLRDVKLYGSRHVVMEHLHAMPPPKKIKTKDGEKFVPGRGTIAAWSLAMICGQLRQAVYDAQIPFTLVSPQRWKAELRITAKGEDAKEQARQRALQLFPDARRWLYRVKDHNRAEALLMAEWGRRDMEAKVAAGTQGRLA